MSRCRFACRSLTAHVRRVIDAVVIRIRHAVSAAVRRQMYLTAAQTTRARAVAAVFVLVLVPMRAAGIEELPWSMPAREFHTRTRDAGETQQPLTAADLPSDPLAPDAGTVGYVLHHAGAASATLVLYNRATQAYQHVCWLVGPLASASDLDAFEPVLTSITQTIRVRGLPPHVTGYTPAAQTMSEQQYDGVPATVRPRTFTPAAITTTTVLPPEESPAPWYVLIARTATVFVLFGAIIMTLRMLCTHREQMAMLRTVAAQERRTP